MIWWFCEEKLKHSEYKSIGLDLLSSILVSYRSKKIPWIMSKEQNMEEREVWNGKLNSSMQDV